MAKKKIISSRPSPYIIPSAINDLKVFIEKNKFDMLEQIVSSLEYAIDHNLPTIEIFQFKKSTFIVTVSLQEFESNLDNIYSFYMENEAYELCGRVVRLQKSLKRNNNEKQTTPKKRKYTKNNSRVE